VFFHNAGYSTACGHGTIALATWAIDSGLVQATEPETTMTVDVPSGRLTATARVSNDTVHSVCFINVPAYVEQLDVPIQAASRPARADIAFGGAFYASVDARALDLHVTPEHLPQFIAIGREIKARLESQGTYAHPLEPELTGIYGVIFYEPKPPRDGVFCQRNVTVFADGEVDRSPCGSGTSARLAILHAREMLKAGDRLLHESIVDTRFESCITATTEIAGRPAVITEIEGSAYRTGIHTFLLDPNDPLGTGFILR
jgi:proline racemase/trans-L-3-hydroxyproline dehydratase